jgi:hypothetical protein
MVEGLVTEAILKQQPCILGMRPVLARPVAPKSLSKEFLVLPLGGVLVPSSHLHLHTTLYPSELDARQDENAHCCNTFRNSDMCRCTR